MNETNMLLETIYKAKRINKCFCQKFTQRTIKFVIFTFLAGFILFTVQVKAQDDVTAALEGKVIDENGKPIPNSIITFTNTENGVSARTQTDNEGRYSKNALKPGIYTVEVFAGNYLPPQIKQVEILATTRIIVLPDFKLKSKDSVAAAPSPTPDTTAAAVITPTPTPNAIPERHSNDLDENRGQIRRSGAFTQNEVTTLPLGSTTLVRSFDELALLVPGVAPPPQAIGNSVGPGVGPGVGTSGQFSVNGLRSRANNFMVDGSDNNDEDIGVRRQGFFSLTPQPIESVQEFQIITLLAPAQFGRNLGAQVNVLSKSGGKDFHGTLYTFFNSDKLNARNYFDFVGNTSPTDLMGKRLDGTSVPVKLDNSAVTVNNTAGDKDSLTFLQGGGTLGGPIVNKKMFFFVSAEGQLLNAQKETHFAVPTVEQRGFLASGAQGLIIPIGTQFQRSSPTSVTGDILLGLFPFPNDPTGLYERNTYTRSLPANARGKVLSGKYDYSFHVMNKQQFLTARYNYTNDWRDLQEVGGAVFSSIRSLTRTDNFSTYISGELTNNLSNVLRFSWGRTHLRFDENKYTDDNLSPISRNFTDHNESQFLLNSLGISNVTTPARTTGILPDFATYSRNTSPLTNTLENYIGPVGQLNILGFSPVGVDVFNFPQKRINNTYQVADTMFLKSGKSNIAFGADIRRTYLSSDLPRNSRLSITSVGAFGNISSDSQVPKCTTALLSTRSLCIPDLISPIDLIAAGFATDVFQTLVLPGSNANIKLSFNQFNFFAQNDYNYNQKLKISYGLRYELNSVPKEADGKIENSFQKPLLNEVSGLSKFIAGRSQIYDLDRNNFAPRIGFAYSPEESTVIRGGYGIYYDQILGAVVSQSRNVFPTFTNVNFGGEPINNSTPLNNIFTPYNTTINGFPIIEPGTLNTLNSRLTQTQLISFASQFFPNPFGATIPEKKLDIPLSHQYSIGIERELFSKTNTVISLAYVGTAGKNLLRFTTPNLGRNNISTVTALSLATSPTFTGNNRSPSRATSNIGSIDQFETTGRSRYDSLQIQLRGRLKPFNQGLQYQVSYTLGNARDDVSDVFDLAGASALPQDSRSFAGEYAAANFDVRHRFTYNFIYDLPELNNRNNLLKYVFGSWQIAGTGRYNSGQPFTVNTIYDVNQDGNATDRLDNTQFIVETGSRRQPLVLTNVNQTSAARMQADLAKMLAPIGRDGSVPRNSFRAGGVLELDMSLIKRFFISEKQDLLLRVDVFNFINRANFGIPVRFLEAPNFGQAVDTITTGRRIQIALKYNF